MAGTPASSRGVTAPVSLADGGLGVALTDPNADRMLFWDDSAGSTAFLTAGSGLTISGTTMTGGVSELAYAEKTADTSIAATSEATATTVVTAGAVVLDGATVIWVETYAASLTTPGGGASRGISLVLFAAVDGGAAAAIGRPADVFNATAAVMQSESLARRKLTPAAGSWVYSLRAFVTAGTGNVVAGAGGAGAAMPAYIRVLSGA